MAIASHVPPQGCWKAVVLIGSVGGAEARVVAAGGQAMTPSHRHVSALCSVSTVEGIRRSVRAAWLVAVCLALVFAACGGGSSEHDHAASFAACLERHGGTTVSDAAQLAGLRWDQAESGSGFRLERLVYQELYVRDRAVVVLFPLGPRTDHMTDADLISAVRAAPRQFREVVLMPPEPSRNVGDIDDACRERVAPGEAVP